MKSNPFSTRFVAPGRIDWVSAPQHRIDQLTYKFLFEFSSRAAIVGPHGSGKSTLLEHLVPGLGVLIAKLQPDQRLPDDELLEAQAKAVEEFGEHRQRNVVWLKIRGGPSARCSLWQTRQLWTASSILVIDGYEQLLPWRRLQIVLETYRRRCGLLLTSHRRTCLKTLHCTLVTMSIAKLVLNQLLPEELPQRHRFLEERRLQALLAAHNGNLREVLMQLYDDFDCQNLLCQELHTPCIPPLRRPK